MTNDLQSLNVNFYYFNLIEMYYLRSIPLVQFDFLVEEILAFHRNVIRFV